MILVVFIKDWQENQGVFSFVDELPSFSLVVQDTGE